MVLPVPKTFLDKLESKRKLSTCGVMVPPRSIGELKKIFLKNGGIADEKIRKMDDSIFLDVHCVNIVAASKNGGVSQDDLEMNKTLCRVLRHIIDEQKKKLMDDDKSDDEEVFKSSMEYRRAVEIICFSSQRIIPLNRTLAIEKKIENIKRELDFLKGVGALPK